MVTLYTYDALDNLTCVEQHGTASGQTGCSSSPSNDSSSAWRIRRFTYDSLGRLVTATNPESGAISYTYDSDGNVLTKYDARGITTTMTYDQLHRVLTKTYSDGTPTATYIYDVAATDGPGSSANPVGRLVEVKNSNAKEVDSYDTRGRIAAQWQCTPLNCGSSWFNLTYSYNYAGGLISESIPMGFTLTPAYDSATRLKQITSSWSDSQHPSSLLSVDTSSGYSPAGSLTKLTYGNGLVELNTYNNRLQPTQMRTYNPSNNSDVLNLSYSFTNSAGTNNGSLVSFISTATQVFMRTYTYDELNRLSTMSSPADASGCYGLTWTYDAWGNRLSQSTSGGSGSACSSPNHGVLLNNRLTDTGFSHDAAGNMISDNLHTYTFDAENRTTALDGTSGTYVYNADGMRIRKTTGGVTTDYVYDPSSNVVAEIQASTWTTGYVYASGRLVAQYIGSSGASGATTLFVHKDHLGSTRILTAMNATAFDSMDYLPFGEQILGGSASTHKFTSKMRDAESGNDYFALRYFGASVGRFTSPDSVANDWELSNPQTWNRYAYARNNPLIYIDPDGAAVELMGETDEDRKKALALIQSGLGNKEAADRLYINEVKDGDKTRYFVGIKGDVGDFMKLSDTAHDLANIVGAKEVVEVALTNKDLSNYGGALTAKKGEIGNQNVRILINPDQVVPQASRYLCCTVLGQTKMGGQDQRPSWVIQPMTRGMAIWHEFGHAWGYIHGRIGTPSGSEAVEWENRIRQQVYGPLGPNNAPRRRD